MVCRRGLRSVSLLYRKGCRSITLFESLCIIRPAVFPAGLRQLVWREHWYPALSQVADPVPSPESSLVPSPGPSLVSNLALHLEPSLYLWVALAGSFGPYLPVQTVSAAYAGPVCLYLRGRAVPASYSCPSLGERYFCVGSLCRLYPASLGLCPGNLCRLCPALLGLCPGSLCRLYPALPGLCPGSPGRIHPALCLACPDRIHPGLGLAGPGRIYPGLGLASPGRIYPCLYPGSPDRIHPGLCLAGPGCFDSDPGRTGNMGPVPRNCLAVGIGSLHPSLVRRPFCVPILVRLPDLDRLPILVRRRDRDRLRPDRQTPHRPKPSQPAQQ